MYISCHLNFKQYLGADKAEAYCFFIIDKLNKKFSDKELDSVFKQKPEEIAKDKNLLLSFMKKIIQ